ALYDVGVELRQLLPDGRVYRLSGCVTVAPDRRGTGTSGGLVLAVALLCLPFHVGQGAMG
uniref:hypothetical protein n=1 Tax=Aeromonas sp. QDB13 TaxID=2990484 RepID=UPI0022E17609